MLTALGDLQIGLAGVLEQLGKLRIDIRGLFEQELFEHKAVDADHSLLRMAQACSICSWVVTNLQRIRLWSGVMALILPSKPRWLISQKTAAAASSTLALNGREIYHLPPAGPIRSTFYYLK